MPDNQDRPPAGDADQPGGPPAPQAPAPPQPAAAQPAAPQAEPPPAPQPPAAPQAPQAAAAATGIGQPADLTTRFFAKLIDWVILGVAYGIVFTLLIVGLIIGAMSGVSGSGTVVGLLGTIVLVGLALGYFAFMESSRGQTFGKMLLKLEVRGPDGNKPSMEQALKRNIYMALYVLNIIPIIGWLLSSLGMLAANIYIAVTINNDAQTRKGWHDEFADGTSVIKVG